MPGSRKETAIQWALLSGFAWCWNSRPKLMPFPPDFVRRRVRLQPQVLILLYLCLHPSSISIYKLHACMDIAYWAVATQHLFRTFLITHRPTLRQMKIMRKKCWVSSAGDCTFNIVLNSFCSIFIKHFHWCVMNIQLCNKQWIVNKTARNSLKPGQHLAAQPQVPRH